MKLFNFVNVDYFSIKWIY